MTSSRLDRYRSPELWGAAPSQSSLERASAPTLSFSPGVPGMCYADPKLLETLAESNKASWPTWWTRIFKTELPVVPIRIDVAEAKLIASLQFSLGDYSLFNLLGVSLANLWMGDSANVQAQLEIQNNGILLRGRPDAAGLPTPRDLMSFHKIGVDAVGPLNVEPDRLAIGNWGGLHLILESSRAYRFILDPKKAPKPTLGHDYPTDQQMEARGQDWISTPLEYRHDKTDISLTDRIPSIFLEADGRLPENYDLMLLAQRALAFIENKPASSGPPLKLDDVKKYLAPGSHLEVDLSHINDLFLPGILDLGQSALKADLSLSPENFLELKTPVLSLRLDPMDYPASPDGATPLLRLKGGLIEAAPAFQVENGRMIEGGFHAVLDPATHDMLVTANLNLQASLEIPFLGPLEVSTHLIAETKFSIGDHGFELSPQSTTLRLENLQLSRPGSATKLLADASFRLNGAQESAHLALTGLLHGKDPLELSGNLPLKKNAQGLYDFSNILEAAPLEVTALLKHGRSTYEAHVSLSSGSISRPNDASDFLEKNFRIKFSVDHYRSLVSGAAGAPSRSEPLLKDGDLAFKKIQRGPDRQEWVLSLAAQRLYPRNLLADLGLAPKGFGNFELRNLAADLEVHRSKNGSVTQYEIPVLELNAKGSPRSPIRGSLNATQKSAQQPATIVWDDQKRLLSFSRINTLFSVQQLDLLPPAFKRFLDKKIATLGLSGAIQGSFAMDLSDKRTSYWHGNGLLTLRGNPAGDVYFLDERGKPVGPAFIRNANWKVRTIRSLNFNDQTALGVFNLDLIGNTSFLPGQSTPDPAAPPVYGANGQKLGPSEINVVMRYDNMPWSASGFKKRIFKYIYTLCQQDEHCSQLAVAEQQASKEPDK